MQLFALHAADGTPIMVTDTREAAVANAWSHELENRQRTLTQRLLTPPAQLRCDG